MSNPRITEGQQFMRPIWTPADAHEVFERAATLQAERGVEVVK